MRKERAIKQSNNQHLPNSRPRRCRSRPRKAGTRSWANIRFRNRHQSFPTRRAGPGSPRLPSLCHPYRCLGRGFGGCRCCRAWRFQLRHGRIFAGGQWMWTSYLHSHRHREGEMPRMHRHFRKHFGPHSFSCLQMQRKMCRNCTISKRPMPPPAACWYGIFGSALSLLLCFVRL